MYTLKHICEKLYLITQSIENKEFSYENINELLNNNGLNEIICREDEYMMDKISEYIKTLNNNVFNFNYKNMQLINKTGNQTMTCSIENGNEYIINIICEINLRRRNGIILFKSIEWNVTIYFDKDLNHIINKKIKQFDKDLNNESWENIIKKYTEFDVSCGDVLFKLDLNPSLSHDENYINNLSNVAINITCRFNGQYYAHFNNIDNSLLTIKKMDFSDNQEGYKYIMYMCNNINNNNIISINNISFDDYNKVIINGSIVGCKIVCDIYYKIVV